MATQPKVINDQNLSELETCVPGKRSSEGVPRKSEGYGGGGVVEGHSCASLMISIKAAGQEQLQR